MTTMEYHLRLRTSLYNYASTFGLKRRQVKSLAREFGFSKVTEAYRLVWDKINHKYGGNVNGKESPTRSSISFRFRSHRQQ